MTRTARLLPGFIAFPQRFISFLFHMSRDIVKIFDVTDLAQNAIAE